MRFRSSLSGIEKPRGHNQALQDFTKARSHEETSLIHRTRTGWIVLASLLFFAPAFGNADPSAVMRSSRAAHDVAPNTDAHSDFWRDAPAVFADRDTRGKAVPHHRTEVRSRWTAENLYFLFLCPYEELHLKPHPETRTETFELWDWDVAEVFIGSDFDHIRRYREFEVSPQAEWVDLDIDLGKPHHEDGWKWNSGFRVATRIDRAAKIWYAAMRIPYRSVDTHAPAAGNTLRINLFRSQGPQSRHRAINWQPTLADTYHVPERFGLLQLSK